MSEKEKLTLLNPEKYKGNSSHPSLDKVIRQVSKATIERDTHLMCWYILIIEFEDGKVYRDSSGSIRGCKQIFAFQCKAGSKWD